MSGTVDAGKLLIAVEASTENLKRQLDAALAAVNSATSGMADSVKKVDTAFGGMGDAIEGAIGILQKLTGSFSPVAASMVGVVAAGTGVERMFEKIGDAALETAKALVEAGDEHVRLVAQLAGVTGSVTAAEAAFGKLEEMALQTGIAADKSAGMFKNLSVAASEVGLSNSKVLDLVKTLQEAGVASGATADQITQVSQSLTVGFLQGSLNARQFRSIITEMPELAKDMADALGLSVAQMVQMAKEGKLTADVIEQGIGGAADKVDTKFKEMPETMSRSWSQMTAAMTQFLAALDKNIGASRVLAAMYHAIAQDVAAAAEGMTHTPVKDLDVQIQQAKKDLEVVNQQIAALGTDPGGFGAGAKKILEDQQAALIGRIKQYANAKKDIIADADAQIGSDERAREAAAQVARDAAAKTSLDKLTVTVDKRAALWNTYYDKIGQLDKIEETLKAGQDPQKEQALAIVERDRSLVLKELNDGLAKVAQSEEVHNKKLDEAIKKANDVAEATRLAAEKAKALYDVHTQGAAAIEEANIQAQINNELTKAGIPLIAASTDIWKQKRAEIEANVRTTVTYDDKLKALTESEAKSKAASEEYARQLAQTSKEIADQISTGFYDMLTNDKKGQSFLDYFKGLFKKLAVQALSANIVLPIIAPIVSAGASFLGVGTAGGSSQVFNAAGQVIGTLGGGAGAAGVPAGVAGASTGSGLFGGGSVLGSLFPAASAANSISGGSIFSSIGNSLGLTGSGGVFSSGGFLGSGGTVSGLLNTQLWSGATTMMPGPTLSGAAGFMGAPGVTLGSVLGGAGAGFGAGMLVNSLLGGKQTGGTIGSAGGALAGAIAGSFIPGIGTLIGGLIGGAAGGGLGGLIGPGPKHQAWGINTQVQDNQIQVIRAIGSDQAGLKAALDDANAQIAQLNQIVSAAGLTVTTAGDYGTLGKGNAGSPQAQTFAESLPTQYRFAGPAGSDLATALANTGGVVQSTQALTDLVTFVTGSYEQLSKTSDKTNQYDDAVTALTTTYNDAIAKATSYGLATDKLSSNLADGVAKIRQAQADAVTATQSGVDVALLTAQGRTYEANTYGMGTGKQKQLDDLQSQLEALGLSAADAAPWVKKLGDAIDLSIANVVASNTLARQQAEIQLQIVEATAAGNTAGAKALQDSLDRANQIKTFGDNLRALGETDAEVTAATKRLSDALDKQAASATAAASSSALIGGLANSLANIFQIVGMPVPKAVTEQLNAIKVSDLAKSLTDLGATTEQVTQWTDAYQNALAAQLANDQADQQESIRRTTAGLNVEMLNAQAAIDPTLKATADMAALLESQKEKWIDLGKTLTAAGATAEQTTDAFATLTITQKAERDALKAQAAAVQNAAGQSIQAYLDKLNATPAGGASPVDQFAAAKKIYGQQLTLAQGGDQTALGNITNNADALLASAKAMFGSGPGYQDILTFVKSSLTGLPAVENYNAEILAAIKALGGTIDVNVSLAVIRSITETLNALPQADVDKLQVSATILHIVEEKLGRPLTVEEWDEVERVAGLNETVIQQVNQILNGLNDDSLKAILNLENVPPEVAQKLVQSMKQLTQPEWDAVAKAANIDPTITQTIDQVLKALGTSDWQSLLKAQGYSETVIQSMSQRLSALTPDQFALIANFPTTNTDVTRLVNQVLKTIGDAAINADPLTKKIVQDVTTNEAIVIHISDTLDGVFGEIKTGVDANYAQLALIARYVAAVAWNTNQAVSGGILIVEKGRVFSGGNVVPFARGGVVSVPTYAPIALFGEAGPEAIMPLKRDSSGRLGVSAQGSNSGRGLQVSRGDDDSEDVTAAFAQVATVMRDEIRLMRGDIQDLRSTLRRAVAK